MPALGELQGGRGIECQRLGQLAHALSETSVTVSYTHLDVYKRQYLEIVPLAAVTVIDWTMDQAMTFVLSGGAVSPDLLDFSGGARREGVQSSAVEAKEA